MNEMSISIAPYPSAHGALTLCRGLVQGTVQSAITVSNEWSEFL